MKYLIFIFIVFTCLCCQDAKDIYDDGINAYKDGDYGKSILLFNEYLLINDTSEIILFNRAKAYFKLCRNNEALKDLRRLSGLHNTKDYYSLNIGMIYYLENNLDSTIKYFENGLLLGSKSYLIRYLLLTSYYAARFDNDPSYRKKGDSLTQKYFEKGYYELYKNFQKDFNNENVFNLKGCAKNIDLMYFPKNNKHKIGDITEGYLFLLGYLPTQISEPEFFLLYQPDTSYWKYDTIKKFESLNGYGYFSLRTDTIKFKGSLIRRLLFGAKVKYLNKSSIHRDTMFYMIGTFITRKNDYRTINHRI